MENIADNFKNLVKGTRSIRNFLPEKYISKETLEELVDVTRFCPSSANLQSLKYRIVYSADECKSVFDNIRWAGYLEKGTVPTVNHESKAYIVICNDKTISKNPLLIDTGIVAQTIMLYANSLGISGCMIGSINREEIAKSLKLDGKFDITLILALGYADETVKIIDCNESIKYYRKDGVHYVPKRRLDEILI